MSFEQKDKILKGFILSSDALFEIKRLMERRPRSRFSDGLSSEAKLAMEQTREDTLLMFDGYNEPTSTTEDDVIDSSEKHNSRKRVQSPRKRPSKGNSKTSKKQISFSENKHDENIEKSKKISTTANDKQEEELTSDRDNVIIDEKSQQNAVEKCKDWIEDNDIDGNAEKQDGASGSGSPVPEYRLSKK